MNKRMLAVALVGIIGTAAVVAACGSSKSGSSTSSSKNTFVLSEFTIVPPTNTLHAGRVSLVAKNVGGEVHELVIARANSLRMKPDGSVDEDKIAKTDRVGEIADISAGSQKTKTFDLRAGTYIAFCNIVDSMMGSNATMMGGSGMGSGAGHVHFAEGMQVPFAVI